MKKHFPKHFIGGLKCDPPFTDKYPDCISNIDGDPKVFLKAFKECGICIYTRGLTHSTGWTLPEFLSQGKFIIAEKSKIQFPVSLVDKEHLVYFSTFDELIYLCEKYLKDENERNRISTNGFNYYQKFVNPSVFITQLLFKTK